MTGQKFPTSSAEIDEVDDNSCGGFVVATVALGQVYVVQVSNTAPTLYCNEYRFLHAREPVLPRRSAKTIVDTDGGGRLCCPGRNRMLECT